ncbi:MAG: hypothetical protein LBS44_04175, partial [Deltaproteobacteria bacterium]|nr:hypothetical protein [Deltaproteobacteria bacterium]
ILSNVAYQGARGLKEPKLIFEANLPFPQPNLTFLLELSVRAGLGRVMDRGPLDPGFENEVFLEKVKNIYDSIDLTDLIRLSATSSILVIHRQILSIINERCPKLKTIFSGK